MTNITEAIAEAFPVLEAGQIPNSRMEANSLLCLALGKNKTFLIAHNEYELSEKERALFRELVTRRASREPFQHIAGFQEFYGLEFSVSPDVLIPRPETELIVEAGIEFLGGIANPRFCEIGIGSGCIAVSILNRLGAAQAFATDISEGALRVAKLNSLKHGVSERLTLVECDLLTGLKHEKFDLIVSNPPYIPKDEFDRLQKEVRDFDPRIALTDEVDGLSIIERIIGEAPNRLKNEGLLLIEIGFGQSEKVRGFLSPEIWRSVGFTKDLRGIPRMVRAEKRGLKD